MKPHRHPIHPLLSAAGAILIASLASCVQPPAPKTYNPAMAKHLRNLTHDAPLTPIPAACGGWGYSYSPYWGYGY